MLCSHVNTHNCVIKSEDKLKIQIPCACLSPFPPVFVIFSSKKRMDFIIKFSTGSFYEEELLSYDCIIISQLRDGPGVSFKTNSELGVSFNLWHFQGIINLIRCFKIMNAPLFFAMFRLVLMLSKVK